MFLHTSARVLRLVFAVAGLAAAGYAAAEVVLFKDENFKGASYTSNGDTPDLDQVHFNDWASSVIVRHGTWQLCQDSGYRGECTTLQPGEYPSLKAIGLNDRVSSVRQLGGGGYHGGGGLDQTTCESVDNREIECEMNTRGNVRIVRQLSKTSCVQGQTWGVNRHGVWVTGGCRAVFAVDSGHDSGGGNYYGGGSGSAPAQVTCESNGNHLVECQIDTHGNVHIVRQLSKAPCTQGVSWGLNRHTVWVSNGCRAVFEVQ